MACRVKKVQNDMTVKYCPPQATWDGKKDMARLPEGFIPTGIEGGQGELKRMLRPGFRYRNYNCSRNALGIFEMQIPSVPWARTNPQSAYGADVISRIMYCGREEGNLGKMQQLITDCFNISFVNLKKNTN